MNKKQPKILLPEDRRIIMHISGKHCIYAFIYEDQIRPKIIDIAELPSNEVPLSLIRRFELESLIDTDNEYEFLPEVGDLLMRIDIINDKPMVTYHEVIKLRDNRGCMTRQCYNNGFLSWANANYQPYVNKVYSTKRLYQNLDGAKKGFIRSRESLINSRHRNADILSKELLIYRNWGENTIPDFIPEKSEYEPPIEAVISYKRKLGR